MTGNVDAHEGKYCRSREVNMKNIEYVSQKVVNNYESTTIQLPNYIQEHNKEQ